MGTMIAEMQIRSTATAGQVLAQLRQGKSVLPEKCPKNRPIAVHAPPDATSSTMKDMKNMKKSCFPSCPSW
jgi:hypothetical protein